MLPRTPAPSLRILGLILAWAATSLAASAQGQLDHVNGHHVGILDFFNTQSGQRHRVPHPDPAQNGLQGDGDGWIGDDRVQVRGLMAGAQLNVDWWTLFGEPVANYTFVWQSSGRYEIRYTDPKKGRVTATVSRDQLAGRPALLKRFDGLKPVEANFEIRWRIGDQTSRDREKFKRKYRLFGSIGGAAPHVKTAMITRLHDGMFLYEPAGKKPFSTPTSPPGGWKAFGSLPDSFDGAEIKMLADYFSISTGQVVNSFRATKFRWPLGEMKAIAEALARIEAGEEIPPAEEARKETAQALPGYAARDEWSEASPTPRPPDPPKPVYDAARKRYRFEYADGKPAFPGEFVSASEFKHGVARVSNDPSFWGHWIIRYNYVDESGKTLFPEASHQTLQLGASLFIVGRGSAGNVNGRCGDWRAGLIDTQSGRYLIPQQSTHRLTVTSWPDDRRPGIIVLKGTTHLRLKNVNAGGWLLVDDEEKTYELDLGTRSLRLVNSVTKESKYSPEAFGR